MSCRVLFDFEAVDPAELPAAVGEVLTVIRQDVDGGWWEAMNASGRHGLIPEGYVELIEDVAIAASPPSSQQPLQQAAEEASYQQWHSSLFNPPSSPLPPPPSSKPPTIPSNDIGACQRFRVTFDFDTDVADELSAHEGDILKILSKDVSDGWWQAENSLGQKGLIPAGYVEPCEEGEFQQTVVDTPTLSPTNVADKLSAHEGDILKIPSKDVSDGWWEAENSFGQKGLIPTGYVVPCDGGESIRSKDSFNSWTSDEDDTLLPPTNPAPPPPTSPASKAPPIPSSAVGSSGLLSRFVRTSSVDPASGKKTTTAAPAAAAAGGVFDRFSSFVKCGGEAYLLGTCKSPPFTEEEVLRIVEDDSGQPQWEPSSRSYDVVISSPKKEDKFHGMKSYISYTLSPSFSQTQVSRRYKHFDWLHKRLFHKYYAICIPGLPVRQLTGRYEDEFIEERMRQLQSWVDRMARHPVISASPLFQFFLTCDNEKRWKEGKRKAERDPVVGGQLFHTVSAPPAPLDPVQTEIRVEDFRKTSLAMSDAVNSVMVTSQDTTKKLQTHFKSQYRRAGAAFQTFANTFQDTKGRLATQALKEAVESTADAYSDIGDLHEEQPKHDWIPLTEKMNEYKGILAAFPDLIQAQQSTALRVSEAQKAQTDGSIGLGELAQMETRGNTISSTVLAEMEHFDKCKLQDYKDIFKSFLREQIDFQLKIQMKLKQSLAHYDSL